MLFEGMSREEINAMIEMWKLGRPIDVIAFLERRDIPEESRERVRARLLGSPNSADNERTGRYRNAQAQILTEVSKMVLPPGGQF
jgi:hypothetical protein